MAKYYALETNDDVADLYIFGYITGNAWSAADPERPEKNAFSIVNELKGVTANNINVHINSMGGDVSEGLAIYNTLKNSGKTVTTYCDGFACSAASVVFMAGSERIMSKESLLMIHNAWMTTAGNADQLRKDADDLEKISETMSNAYLEGTSISKDELKTLLANETWISADEAKGYGFATKITDDADSDSPKLSAMASVKARLTSRPEPTAADIADEISNKVISAIESKQAEAKAEPKEEPKAEETPAADEPETKADPYGWNAFFTQKKEKAE